ncbi:MAG TPA: exodeoxyribonuclease VII small subunit [Bacteroidota bacterium]
MSKTPSFEHSLKRLQQIVETLEEGSVNLEDVMKMYEEGVDLSRKCLEQLQQVEVKLKRLGKEIDGTFKLTDQKLEE